jgi:hypothetical protein
VRLQREEEDPGASKGEKCGEKSTNKMAIKNGYK